METLNKEELIELLNSDIEKFNNYRIGTNFETIDLRSANLRFADLSSANLRYADLRFADLRSADLSSANLRYADLRYADLRSADLSSANLRYADLRYADLDFCCWLFMGCKSFNVEISIEQIKQLLYHVCRFECDDIQFAEIKDKIKEYANQANVIERHNLDKIE